MLRAFLKNHDFDPDMLIRVMLIKNKACTSKLPGELQFYRFRRLRINRERRLFINPHSLWFANEWSPG